MATPNATQVNSSSSSSVDVSASKPAEAAKSTQRFQSFKLGYPTTTDLLSGPATPSENCLLAGIQKAAYVFAAAITALLETVQNAVCATLNVGVWVANGVHSVLVGDESAPVDEAAAKKAADEAAAKKAADEAAAKKLAEDDALLPEPTNFEVVKDKLLNFKDFVQSHKPAFVGGATGGISTALGVGYFAGFGALAATGIGAGAAVALGYAANYAANHYNAVKA